MKRFSGPLERAYSVGLVGEDVVFRSDYIELSDSVGPNLGDIDGVALPGDSHLVGTLQF